MWAGSAFARYEDALPGGEDGLGFSGAFSDELKLALYVLVPLALATWVFSDRGPWVKWPLRIALALGVVTAILKPALMPFFVLAAVSMLFGWPFLSLLRDKIRRPPR